MWRRALIAVAVTLGLLAVTGAAVGRGQPSLRASGPTSVTGTTATAVFAMGERMLRQVRYDDRGTLRYTFRLHNDGRLPVRVTGLAGNQPDPRLFDYRGLTAVTVPAGDSRPVTLSLRMTGCEALSARAGSFATVVRLRTREAGLFTDAVTVRLPEQVHTGSPREAACPRATASSRPRG